MIPNFVLFGKVISVYMLTALAGILAVLYYAYRMAQKNGLDEIHMLYMMLFSMIGVGVGGHLLYGITNFDKIIWLVTNIASISSWKALWDQIFIIFGGSVFYGGLIGGILVALLYAKKQKLELGPYSDIGATVIPFFHTFGRIGCFLSGCCFGIPWEHGFIYHHSAVAEANFIPRFPVQLVEAGLNLALFFVLFYCLKTHRLKSHLLHLYLLVYPVYRFLLEFLRGDAYRGFLWGLSTSQIISVILFTISAISWGMSGRQTRQHIPSEAKDLQGV